MKKTFLFLLVMICSLFLWGEEEVESVLALVGEEVITSSDIMASVYQEEMDIRRRGGRDMRKKIAELRKNTLESLIEQELLYLEFVRLKAQFPEEYLQSRLNEQIERFAGGDVKSFEDQLFRQGTTVKEYRKRLNKRLAAELLLRDRITKGNYFSDSAVEEYYEKNQKLFATARQVRVSSIQLKGRGRYAGKIEETFQELKKKLANGESFENLAKTYSEGILASRGGDLGWQKEFAEPIEKLLATLEVGQVASSLMKIGENYYWIKVTGRQESGVMPLDNELKEQIRKFLVKQEEQRRHDEFMRELTMRYPVHRMDAPSL